MDKKQLLKSLLPGFLPLIVFILADEIWGTKIGLIVAIAFGMTEFFVSLIKNKKADFFILGDTILLLILGAVSLLFNNPIFFKLKPALIEGILALLLGFSAYSSSKILLGLTHRYTKIEIEENSPEVISMQKSLKFLFFLILTHIAAVVYSAIAMSKETWAFISGGLFYIIFGVYAVIEFIRKKREHHLLINEEWLPVINENGEVIGKSPRSHCHRDPNLIHPVIHLQLFNSKMEWYLQKRPINKETQPGKWDTAVGGHLSFEEPLQEGLFREAEEELGIKDFSPLYLGRYFLKNPNETEMVFLLCTVFNGKITPDPDELDGGKFWSSEEIKMSLGKGIFTPNFEEEFEILEPWLAKMKTKGKETNEILQIMSESPLIDTRLLDNNSH